MSVVVLVGTLDTKGREYGYLRSCLLGSGLEVVLVDTGTMGAPAVAPDIDREEVARAAGLQPGALAGVRDRGAAVEVMARGAARVVRRLREEGRLDGLLGIGGSSGSTIVASAMQGLPFGIPKLLISTMASGNVGPYVGGGDVMLSYSVVDLAGLNRISEDVLRRGAAAMAGMLASTAPARGDERPLVGMSVFGVTTPCATAASEHLAELGYEVLPFHGTGAGGRSLEGLAASGVLAGVLDLTTSELVDDLVGGVCTAGPDRLTAAGRRGVPQVVSVGALDMVNYGPPESVPERFRSRRLHVHNPSVTLMRTTPEECAEVGRLIATKLNAASGPCVLFLPLRGVSSLSVEGQPFFDPVADDALFESLRRTLRQPVEICEMDTDINDPAFAVAMADALDRMLREASLTAGRTARQ